MLKVTQLKEFLPLRKWPGPKAWVLLQELVKKQNASPFLRLPVEILAIQILRYFPDVPIGVPRELRSRGDAPLLPDVVLERFQVLRALAQTCWKLRNICLPLQWEQLNLCAFPHGSKYWLSYSKLDD